MRLNYALFLAFVLLAGCSSLGIEPATNYDQREAYALGTLTAIRDAAANSVRLGDLSREDGQDVLDMTDDARAMIDSARLIHDAGDVTEASTRLAAVSEILRQLQSYLRGAP